MKKLKDTKPAWLHMQGHTQKHRQDYNETFSPVVRFEFLRMVTALAVKSRAGQYTNFVDGTVFHKTSRYK